MARKGSAERKTAETFVKVDLDLDGEGRTEVATGVGFLDHLLHLLAHHSGMDLTVEARGDTWVDDHHTVEDTGLVLGRAFDEALGDRGGITRFADASAPLIEALSTVVVDLGARSHLTCNATQTPRNGLPVWKASLQASSIPRSRSFLMHSPKPPPPGSTTVSAADTRSGSGVRSTFAPAFSNARITESVLPAS